MIQIRLSGFMWQPQSGNPFWEENMGTGDIREAPDKEHARKEWHKIHIGE